MTTFQIFFSNCWTAYHAQHMHSDFAPFIVVANNFVPENVDSKVVNEVDNFNSTENDGF